jgi:hypothetical protein
MNRTQVNEKGFTVLYEATHPTVEYALPSRALDARRAHAELGLDLADAPQPRICARFHGPSSQDMDKESSQGADRASEEARPR